MVRAVRALLIAGGLWGAQIAAADTPVLVFAAASLKNALDDVAAHYEESEGQDVVMSYAGSSALARQIENGAPADVFISANTAWMDALQQAGLINGDTRMDLLSNRLVLIAPTTMAADVRLDQPERLVGALGQDRLALALVDSVPAGIYAQQALRALDLWDLLAPRLAQTANVRAALRLVSLGEAPLGIVYATDALADPGVRVVDRFAPDLHEPITYPVALLNPAPRQQAQAFYDYLAGSEAADIFRAHGFLIAGAHDE